MQLFAMHTCTYIYYSDHLGNKVINLPVITADITDQSKILQCHTDQFKSLCAGDCIYSRKWIS